MSASRTVFLSAGESSGDLHGAELARRLRERLPGIRLIGLGGSRMAAEGVELVADLDRLAVLGLAEVVRHLPDLLRLRREVYRLLEREGVDLVVPIDYPGFNLPLAGRAHARGIAVVYYIAPQVWAWKERRAAKLAEWCDEVCVVLPFEADLLRDYGARATFVGHPLLDRPLPSAYGDRRAVGLFPGSRRQEVERMLPVFLEATAHLRADPSLGAFDVLVARSSDLPTAAYAACPPELLAAPDDVMARSRAAITKSGTITLQLALADVPMVVAYRVHPLTYGILRRLVTLDSVALVNLVADERVVAECLQDDMTPERLAAELRPLLDDGPARRSVLDGLARVRGRLGEPGAADRVCDVCLDWLGRTDAA
ncbi:MAG TPA: lipid-A-disaccharide synthase [Gemmatimonadota bacterium]|nr:lipid-A-disaccharide synthase [Gemmatimonadota bacterium]